MALLVTLVACLAFPAGARADFSFLPGAEGFDVSALDEFGAPATAAGSHPNELEINLGFEKTGAFADGDLRELHLEMPPGLLFSPAAVETCSQEQFNTPRNSPFEASLSGENCPKESQVGTVAVHSSYGGGVRYFGLFNLVPPYGSPEAIGFAPFGVPIVLTPHVREEDSGLTLDIAGLPQILSIDGLDFKIWGTPWEFDHDSERGNCLNEVDPSAYHGVLSTPGGPGNVPPFQLGTCSIGSPDIIAKEAKSFPTLPTSPCGVPLTYAARATSWQGETADATAATPPLDTCNTHKTVPKLQLTTDKAAIGAGLVFNLDVADGGGILNPRGVARPAIKEAVVSLPEGVTINPSVGSGLGVCSEADFAREAVDTIPGTGCPNASKIGQIEVQGMLGLSEPLRGSLFVAQPYDNPFGTLVAVYMVASNPRRGLFVKSIGKVDPDPRSGRLVTTFDNLPRLLYTHFSLSFREGKRAVMISPAACGEYATTVELASWADPSTFSSDSASIIPIRRGPTGESCPSGTAPFRPKLTSGSLNPVGGAYSPFLLHMTRADDDQEITSYSATFPPGLLANISGVTFCPEAAIEAAKHRSAAAEEASPSCPASSYLGRSLAGYGVGDVLAYAPGALYLAGPYHGAPLSVVAITAARVGPFDLETVVIRSAVRIDPITAQASIDAQGSDPIPHILKGIPLHLRDIRVYMDRPQLTLNPTSCDQLTVSSLLTGAGSDPFSTADDVSAVAPDRFQLLDCAARGFAPRMRLELKGGTKRGKYPSLKAIVTPRPGDANISQAKVTLPPSEFLAQENIDTICTRGQSAAGKCPPGSIYGKARAVTPLLDEPLEGPVYLRSSDHPLPDLVASLTGRGVRIDVVGRIDSYKGGMRATYDVLPDAPVTRFSLTLKGGDKKGLLVNSDNSCKAPPATARMVGHNNKGILLRPPLINPVCNKKGKAKVRKKGQKAGHTRGAKR